MIQISLDTFLNQTITFNRRGREYQENQFNQTLKTKEAEQEKELVYENKKTELPQTPGGEQLGDHVDSGGGIIDPIIVQLDNIVVLEGLEQVNLRVQLLQLLRRLHNVLRADPVPRNLNSVHFVKRFVPAIVQQSNNNIQRIQ